MNNNYNLVAWSAFFKCVDSLYSQELVFQIILTWVYFPAQPLHFTFLQ